ncbi:MAG: hypothetical protein INR71_15400 [Terriglobus roseus]|nr:hypothetical protein [Terriglobus roseus]
MSGKPDGEGQAAPGTATEAVLKPSQPLPEGTREVSGINFDDHPDGISAQDLLAGMAGMGFQASGVAEAVRIINDMVTILQTTVYGRVQVANHSRSRYHGGTRRAVGARPSSWATRPT